MLSSSLRALSLLSTWRAGDILIHRPPPDLTPICGQLICRPVGWEKVASSHVQPSIIIIVDCPETTPEPGVTLAIRTPFDLVVGMICESGL